MPAPRQIRCEDCCSIHNGPFFVMHTGCVGLIDRRTAILPLDVARRMWMPSAMEEKDRRERIRRLLDQAFCVNEFRILPAEIRNMITPYLLKEYSVCTISNAWLERRRVEGDGFDWMGEIWAEYVKIDGRWYVCNLANSMRRNRGPSIQLRKPEVLDMMHIAIDYLGIRRIILETYGSPTADGHMADPEPGV